VGGDHTGGREGRAAHRELLLVISKRGEGPQGRHRRGGADVRGAAAPAEPHHAPARPRAPFCAPHAGPPGPHHTHVHEPAERVPPARCASSCAPRAAPTPTRRLGAAPSPLAPPAQLPHLPSRPRAASEPPLLLGPPEPPALPPLAPRPPPGPACRAPGPAPPATPCAARPRAWPPSAAAQRQRRTSRAQLLRPPLAAALLLPSASSGACWRQLLPVCAEEKERERIGTGLCCRGEKRLGRQRRS
jgi:hypothetical protein